MTTKVSIVGAGIAGLTTAIALQNVGIEFVLFEASPSIKAVGAGLSLAANAIKGFEKLGIKNEVIAQGRLVNTFTTCDAKGKVISSVDTSAISQKYGGANLTIQRASLHALLLSKINPMQVFTDKKSIGFEKKDQGILLKFADGSNYYSDYVIVAEGIHSPIRNQLLPISKIRYAGYTCCRAVIDNSSLQLSQISESFGSMGRFGIVPLADQKIYWFACITTHENDQRVKNFKIKDLKEQFKGFHEPIQSILDATSDEDLIWNDIIDLKPLEHFAFGNVVLIGDAAHATTPNMGQGACQAVEDAVILADEMSKTHDWQLAFKSFESRRLKRTRFIVERSWDMGKMFQLENQLLGKARNFLFRILPKSILERQLRELYKTDF